MASSNGKHKVESKVTPIGEWRAAVEGTEMPLVSGYVARIRAVNTDTFLKCGYIPNELMHVVEEVIQGRVDESKAVTSEEYLEKHQPIFDAFVKTCFVWPRVVDVITDADNEITPDMVSDVDKRDLFSYLGRPARELVMFHPFPPEPVEPVAVEQDTEPVTE